MESRGAEALGLGGRGVGLFLPASGAPRPFLPPPHAPPASVPPTARSLAEDPEAEREGGPGRKERGGPPTGSRRSPPSRTVLHPPEPPSEKPLGNLDFTVRRFSRSGHLVPCTIQAPYTWPLDPISFYKLIN